MKRVIILLLIWVGSLSALWAIDGYHQQISSEEFRAKQQAFITEKAELTADEVDKFFPVYFELQDKKRELNGQIWKLLRNKDEKRTDEQYDNIMLEVYDLRIESDKLDKVYYQKFKKILSPKKIYMVQRAEMRFQRELVKGVHHNKGEGKPGKQQGKK